MPWWTHEGCCSSPSLCTCPASKRYAFHLLIIYSLDCLGTYPGPKPLIYIAAVSIYVFSFFFFFVALMYASACIQTQRTLKRTHAIWELSKTNTRWSWKRMFGCISKLSAIVMKFETRSMMFPHILSPLLNLRGQRHAKSAFIRHWASTCEDEHAQGAAYQCIRNESV